MFSWAGAQDPVRLPRGCNVDLPASSRSLPWRVEGGTIRIYLTYRIHPGKGRVRGNPCGLILKVKPEGEPKGGQGHVGISDKQICKVTLRSPARLHLHFMTSPSPGYPGRLQIDFDLQASAFAFKEILATTGPVCLYGEMYL